LQKQQTICDLTFPTTVLAVRLNRKRLVVILEDLIYLYEISNMKLLYTIETSPNPQGRLPTYIKSQWESKLINLAICALSSSSDNCYLAYPLPQKTLPLNFAPPSHAPPNSTHIAPTTGDVLLFDASKLEAVNVVTAHRSPLSHITLNNTGTLLATASDKGTIIRVFSVPKADKLYQFRRGALPASIYCMSFNATSSLLCISSATETVHVFKLGGPSSSRRPSMANNPDSSPPSSSHSNLPWQPDRSNSPAPSDSQPDFASFASHSHSASTDSAAAIARRKHNGTLMGMIRRTSQTVGSQLATAAGAYLPTAVAEMWEPARDFAWCRIPKPGQTVGGAGGSAAGGASAGGGTVPLRSVVAMSGSSPQVMVVTNEGHFYVFGIDLEKGGEGTLVKVYEVGAEGERIVEKD